MTRVAFIGLGVMGFPMAGHLPTTGHQVTGVQTYRRTRRGLVRELSGPAGRHASRSRGERRDRAHLRRQRRRPALRRPWGRGDPDRPRRSRPADQDGQPDLHWWAVAGARRSGKLHARASLDPDQVLATISKGAAQSWQMDNRWPSKVAGRFDFGFAVGLTRKDLGVVLEESRRNGPAMPVTALVDQFYRSVQDQGGGKGDTSSLVLNLRGK